MPDTSLHRRIVARAHEVLPADPRIVAAWLEGSLVAGTADRWSDVDLHVAVGPDDFDGVVADGERLVGELAPVLAALRFPLGPVRLVAATVEGPVRVDLYVEPLAAVASIPRLAEPDVFHGDPPPFTITDKPVDPAAHLARLVGGYFFGFMTPGRLIGRDSHATVVLNLVQVIFQFVVPVLLAQSNPGQVFREHLHAEQHLPHHQRRRVQHLVRAAAKAATGDPGDVRHAHEVVLGTLLTELRAACEQHDVAWPSATEQQARNFFRAELGLDLAPGPTGP